jgi:hypothetical protein
MHNAKNHVGTALNRHAQPPKLDSAVQQRRTLAEVVLLIVISVVLLLGLMTAVNTVNAATMYSSANLASSGKLDEYRDLQFTDLPAMTPINTLQPHEDFTASLPDELPFPRSGVVFVSSISPNLKQVVSYVSYGSGSEKQVIQHTMFISSIKDGSK